MSKHGKRALVTGGAGLIGSHVTDLLVGEGWKVRVLDNLEPNTHKRGKPAWINPNAGFIEGDLRDRETITAALDKIDVVFHQAAYGGYMPEIAKFSKLFAKSICQLEKLSLRARRLFIAKARANAQITDWFSRLCVPLSNCAKAIGKCVARAAARSQKVFRRRKTRRSPARPFTA